MGSCSGAGQSSSVNDAVDEETVKLGEFSEPKLQQVTAKQNFLGSLQNAAAEPAEISC